MLTLCSCGGLVLPTCAFRARAPSVPVELVWLTPQHVGFRIPLDSVLANCWLVTCGIPHRLAIVDAHAHLCPQVLANSCVHVPHTIGSGNDMNVVKVTNNFADPNSSLLIGSRCSSSESLKLRRGIRHLMRMIVGLHALNPLPENRRRSLELGPHLGTQLPTHPQPRHTKVGSTRLWHSDAPTPTFVMVAAPRTTNGASSSESTRVKSHLLE